MQDQEVPDSFELQFHEAVIFIPQHRIAAAIWKQLEQMGNRTLDQVNAGRLERLQKAARQPDRHAVSSPDLLAPSGRETQDSRIRERFAFEALHERLRGGVIADERTRVHVTVADAMLQRNAPLPTCFPCGRASVWNG